MFLPSILGSPTGGVVNLNLKGNSLLLCLSITPKLDTISP